MTDSSDNFKTISVERRGAGIWLTLDRPDKLNVFDDVMVAEIDHVLSTYQEDNTVAALVLTGAGRAFCVGGDLSFVDEGMGQGARDPRTVLLEQLNAVCNRLERFPKPVIAAVNGMALAGGLEFVACCDLVFCSEKAKLGDVHQNYGLIPGGGNSQRLPRKMGLNFAKYLLFTGEMLPPERFIPCGFVNEVLPVDSLVPRVEEVVAALGEKSPLALRRVKQLVQDGIEQPLESGLRLELAMSEAHAMSFDMREGVTAFVEKRKPKFEGR